MSEFLREKKIRLSFRRDYAMSGNLILVDTNVLIYMLNGDSVIAESLQEQQIVISFITEIELQCYEMSEAVLKKVKDLITQCIIIEMNAEIKAACIDLIRLNKLKLADGIVAGTAIAYDLPLITADKQFSKIKELNLILYQPTP
jgi:predicted nucleic acid-binding protein